MIIISTIISAIAGTIVSYIFFGLMGGSTWHYLAGVFIGIGVGTVFKKLTKQSSVNIGALATIITFICLLLGNYLYVKNRVDVMPPLLDACISILKSWYFSGFFKMIIFILIPTAAYTTIVMDEDEEGGTIKSAPTDFGNDDKYLDV